MGRFVHEAGLADPFSTDQLDDLPSLASADFDRSGEQRVQLRPATDETGLACPRGTG